MGAQTRFAQLTTHIRSLTPDPVVAPAIRLPTGHVIPSPAAWEDGTENPEPIHGDAMMVAIRQGVPKADIEHGLLHGAGFVTRTGKFLTRQDAVPHLMAHDQLQPTTDAARLVREFEAGTPVSLDSYDIQFAKALPAALPHGLEIERVYHQAFDGDDRASNPGGEEQAFRIAHPSLPHTVRMDLIRFDHEPAGHWNVQDLYAETGHEATEHSRDKANTLGPSAVRAITRHLRDVHGIRALTGQRVTGMRQSRPMMPDTTFTFAKARNASAAVLDTRTSGPFGATPGGFHRDRDNTVWYAKWPDSEHEAHVEHLTNQIYRGLGLHAPHSTVREHPDHRPIYLSKHVPGFQTLRSGRLTEEHPGPDIWSHGPGHAPAQFLRGLAADALVGNEDLHSDNVGLVHGQSPMRLDNGESVLQAYDYKTAHVVSGIHALVLARTQEPLTHAVDRATKIGIDVTSPRFLRPQVQRIQQLRAAHGGWQGFVNTHIPGAAQDVRRGVADVLESRTQRLIDHVNGTKEF